MKSKRKKPAPGVMHRTRVNTKPLITHKSGHVQCPMWLTQVLRGVRPISERLRLLRFSRARDGVLRDRSGVPLYEPISRG